MPCDCPDTLADGSLRPVVSGLPFALSIEPNVFPTPSSKGELSLPADYTPEDCRVSSLRESQPVPELGNASSAEDRALVSAILQKDRKATAEFVARYTDEIYGYVRCRLFPRYDVVNDVVQEVFLAAWENLGQFRGEGSLRSWLLGIARHKVETYYRTQLRTPEPIENYTEDPGIHSTFSITDRLEQEQIRKKAWQVMSSLPEHYRLVLIWRYWERTPARDIAIRTGKTEKAIERLLARARAVFRERWDS